MKLATTIAQTVVRTLGPIQIGLGVLFWTYNALNLIPLHMLIGLVVVLALWVLAGLGLRAGVHPGLASAAFAWGVLVIALGMTQMQILPVTPTNVRAGPSRVSAWRPGPSRGARTYAALGGGQPALTMAAVG